MTVTACSGEKVGASALLGGVMRVRIRAGTVTDGRRTDGPVGRNGNIHTLSRKSFLEIGGIPLSSGLP